MKEIIFWVAPSHFFKFFHETFRNCLLDRPLDTVKWTPILSFRTFCLFAFLLFFCLNLVASIFTVNRISLFFYAFSPYFLLQPAGLSILIFNNNFYNEKLSFFFMTWTNFPNKKHASFVQTL